MTDSPAQTKLTIYVIVYCVFVLGFFGLLFGVLIPKYGAILTFLLMLVVWVVLSLATAFVKIKTAQWEQRNLNR
jgi:hypothetical protein